MKTNNIESAWWFYEEMKRSQILPDSFTFSILVTGLKNNKVAKKELFRTLEEIDIL
jgi:hypothetical protein